MTDDLKPVTIYGILALQGDYEAHRKMFESQVGVKTAFVRTPHDLDAVDALVLPGGESTTIAKLMNRNGLDAAIQTRLEHGMPAFGTCAGLILLSKRIDGRPNQPTLGAMDVTVARNTFGRQVDSFEADIPFQDLEGAATPVRGVFIRAPYVTEAGPKVQILAHFDDKIVAVRQGNLLGIAFHPELTDDARVHTHFARIVERSREKRT